jgi:hypothetical protein
VVSRAIFCFVLLSTVDLITREKGEKSAKEGLKVTQVFLQEQESGPEHQDDWSAIIIPQSVGSAGHVQEKFHLWSIV